MNASAHPHGEHPAGASARQSVQMADVVDIAKYEKIRSDFRTEVIRLKDRRRVEVGPHFTFLFENFKTVLYQIQEMMRVERIVDDKSIAYEIATYNTLIPGEESLSATLLLEYDGRDARARELPALVGIEKHVWLAVGGLAPVPGEFDESQIGEERISAVQYVRFRLPAEHRAQWGRSAVEGELRIRVDHPHYGYETVLSPEVAESLGEHLRPES